MKTHKSFLQFISLLIAAIAFLFMAAPPEKITEDIYALNLKELQEQKQEQQNFKIFEIRIDDQEVFVRTEKESVEDILAKAPICLNSEDKTIPGRGEIALNQIEVIRVTKEKVAEEKMLAYSTEERTSADLFSGETRILQKGEKGIEKSIYEVIMENGKEVARNFVEKVVLKEPVKQIVAMGTRQVVSRGGSSLEFTEAYTMTATAYTHTGNKTYTGIWPSVGTISVDPKVIPLGTRLYVDGYGYGTAMDTGGSIKGKRIDVFMDTEQEALKWGRRQVKVFVLQTE